VHPLLRLALSTLILVDRDMLITDSGRLPEDYGRMGITDQQPHRHYKQADGWIHAVDLRTTRPRRHQEPRGAVLLLADGIRDSKTRRHGGPSARRAD